MKRIFTDFDLKFVKIDAKERFFRKLDGVNNTEKKRKIIGKEFIRIFEKEAQKLGAGFLIQGPSTLISSGQDHRL